MKYYLCAWVQSADGTTVLYLQDTTTQMLKACFLKADVENSPPLNFWLLSLSKVMKKKFN